MPEPTIGLDDVQDNDDYAVRAAQMVRDDPEVDMFAVGGAEEQTQTCVEYAIEPERGACARFITDELASVIEDLPDFRDGAAIVTREVHYGPWRHITPEEIRNA